MVIRLEGDAWSMSKRLKASGKLAPPPLPPPSSPPPSAATAAAATLTKTKNLVPTRKTNIKSKCLPPGIFYLEGGQAVQSRGRLRPGEHGVRLGPPYGGRGGHAYVARCCGQVPDEDQEQTRRAPGTG